jgi:hypothetical protein
VKHEKVKNSETLSLSLSCFCISDYLSLSRSLLEDH